MTETDKQVLCYIKDGDIDAYGAIFKEYYPELCKRAARYLVDPADAEEVVQDLFIKLWEKRDSIVINTSLPAYLHTAVSNHAINYWKIKKRLPKHPGGTAEIENLETAALDESIIYEDLEKQLNTLLKKMPEKRRMIFQMSRFENMKNHEIAKELKISIKTVEYNLSRALSFLEKNLKDYLPLILLILHFLKLF